jgi:hypothetical protein
MPSRPPTYTLLAWRSCWDCRPKLLPAPLPPRPLPAAEKEEEEEEAATRAAAKLLPATCSPGLTSQPLGAEEKKRLPGRGFREAGSAGARSGLRDLLLRARRRERERGGGGGGEERRGERAERGRRAGK